MKLGIIGAGNVGGGPGRLWAAKGHEVLYGLRDPYSDSVRTLLADCGPSAGVGTVAAAGAFGEVVVLAVPWPAAQKAVEATGDLTDKVLIDCTNPVAPGLKPGVAPETSAAEKVAGWAPGAKVVKAFNTLGLGNLADLTFGGLKADTYLCGDDAKAKPTVAKLAEQIGFEVVDTGGLERARLVEPLALLWINLAYAEGFGPSIAFKLLRR